MSVSQNKNSFIIIVVFSMFLNIDIFIYLIQNFVVMEKAAGTTWTASMNTRFANATIADAKRFLGTILPHEEGYVAPEVERTVFKAATIPESFDARTGFSKCADVIGHVRDQSSCGTDIIIIIIIIVFLHFLCY